ncbi:MAG TPA: cytochrome C oxidase subunit IV family protein [Terriglobales bacterium]|jgi:cytochrome c oxidase subunit 4|nr:cytochrome C oxidase subunit IV family protein [Terriglobales bacterium]
MSEHIVSRKLYVAIGTTLLVLTATTVGIAFINLGPFNTIVALSIATAKALLVILFFMHVKYTSEKMTRVVIVAAVFWLLLLLALSMADYGTRLWH